MHKFQILVAAIVISLLACKPSAKSSSSTQSAGNTCTDNQLAQLNYQLAQLQNLGPPGGTGLQLTNNANLEGIKNQLISTYTFGGTMPNNLARDLGDGINYNLGGIRNHCDAYSLKKAELDCQNDNGCFTVTSGFFSSTKTLNTQSFPYRSYLQIAANKCNAAFVDYFNSVKLANVGQPQNTPQNQTGQQPQTQQQNAATQESEDVASTAAAQTRIKELREQIAICQQQIAASQQQAAAQNANKPGVSNTVLSADVDQCKEITGASFSNTDGQCHCPNGDTITTGSCATEPGAVKTDGDLQMKAMCEASYGAGKCLAGGDGIWRPYLLCTGDTVLYSDNKCYKPQTAKACPANQCSNAQNVCVNLNVNTFRATNGQCIDAWTYYNNNGQKQEADSDDDKIPDIYDRCITPTGGKPVNQSGPYMGCAGGQTINH